MKTVRSRVHSGYERCCCNCVNSHYSDAESWVISFSHLTYLVQLSYLLELGNWGRGRWRTLRWRRGGREHQRVFCGKQLWGLGSELILGVSWAVRLGSWNDSGRQWFRCTSRLPRTLVGIVWPGYLVVPASLKLVSAASEKVGRAVAVVAANWLRRCHVLIIDVKNIDLQNMFFSLL